MIFYRNICLRLITEFLKENQKIVHRIEEGLLQYAHANKNLAWQQALKESNSPMLETTLRNQIVMQPVSVNIAVQSNESNSANMMMVTAPQ